MGEGWEGDTGRKRIRWSRLGMEGDMVDGFEVGFTAIGNISNRVFRMSRYAARAHPLRSSFVAGTTYDDQIND